MKPVKEGGSILRMDEGIFMIPGRKSGGCNVYVLKGENKVALIDVGMPGDYEIICAGLAEIDLTIDDVGMVIITHEHIDHFGGLRNLPKRMVVAAHSRTANKLRLDDEFSTMSGAFGARDSAGHVDILLEDGSLIDLGGIRLRTIYTPGHCSGAICLYEPARGILFTADTIFAGGILGGIFASGNISDYINSLERLTELRLVSMYPGHGRMSSTPMEDLERAIRGSALLMSDTRNLFESIHARNAFEQIKKATISYSRRAAERRLGERFPSNLDVIVHLPDADHPISMTNVSKTGARLDRELSVQVGDVIAMTVADIGDLKCEVVGQVAGHTRLKFLKQSPDFDSLQAWLKARAALKVAQCH